MTHNRFVLLESGIRLFTGFAHTMFIVGEVMTINIGSPNSKGNQKSFIKIYKERLSVQTPNTVHNKLPIIHATAIAAIKVTHTYMRRFLRL